MMLHRPTFITVPLPRLLSRRSPYRKSRRARTKCTQAAKLATSSLPHEPVLVSQILSLLSNRPLHTVVDGTVGAGGHASRLLSNLPISRYIGIDKDPSALSLAAQTLSSHQGVTLLHGDFRDFPSILSTHGVLPGTVDAVLLDVGVSSMQLDEASRGFSFTRDGPLDMRMSGASDATSAADLVNGASEATLERVLREYGEERQARKIAAAIVADRAQNGDIMTTGRLADIVARVKGWRKKGVHPATLTFQAVRIAVNGELDALQLGLPGAIGMLRRGSGRLAVVCFHSLEDRIAKTCFREMAQHSGGVGIVTKRPVVADEEECRRNVRSRSAKLRVVQRLDVDEEPWGRKVNKYARDR